MFWHRPALFQLAYCRVLAGLLHLYDLDIFLFRPRPLSPAPKGGARFGVLAPICPFPICLMQSISWAITFSRFGHFPVVTAPALSCPSSPKLICFNNVKNKEKLKKLKKLKNFKKLKKLIVPNYARQELVQCEQLAFLAVRQSWRAGRLQKQNICNV